MRKRLVSVTETCFCERNFFWRKLVSVTEFFCDTFSLTDFGCLWQNFFSVAETFFLWQKCILLRVTHKEFVSLTKTFVCEISFFSFFLSQMIFCHRYFILWQKFVLSKTPFSGHFIYVFQGKFPSEMRSWVISDTQDTHFVDPWSGQLLTISWFFYLGPANI